jgi:hypothetical protein
MSVGMDEVRQVVVYLPNGCNALEAVGFAYTHAGADVPA